MKKYVGSVLIAFALVAMAAFSAQAAWYTVTVNNVGADNTTVNLRITDTKGAFSNIWVQASGSTADQIMATALTASALDKKLLVNLSAPKAWAALKGAYIIN